MKPIDWQIFFERTAHSREKWNRRNRFYHRSLEKYFSFIIPPGKRVLELGYGTGELSNAVRPEYGVGVDFSETIIKMAKAKHPGFLFKPLLFLDNLLCRISGQFAMFMTVKIKKVGLNA